MGGMGAGNYCGRTHDMCADFTRWMREGWRIIVLSGGAASGERMSQSFEDEGVKAAFVSWAHRRRKRANAASIR